MEYSDLIIEIANRTKYTRREVRNLLRVISEVISKELAGGRYVQWLRFGKFTCYRRPPGVGGDPITKERIAIPEMTQVKFIPTAELKDKVKAAINILNEPDLLNKYLPKGVSHGEVRGGNRPRESGKGKGGRKETTSRR